MTNLADEPSRPIKLLLIGDSGVGKTGALASLAPHYKIRIINMDRGDGIAALKAHIRDKDPAALANVDYEDCQDQYKFDALGRAVVVGIPKALPKAFRLCNKWTDKSNPAEWGQDHILVVDSITAMGRAAMTWADPLLQNVDRRQTYGAAQDVVQRCIETLSGDSFNTNVIVIGHINYPRMPNKEEKAAGLGSSPLFHKAFTTAVGRALGPIIPQYFNTLLLSEVTGTGSHAKRKIKTLPTGWLDLKNPNPMKMEGSYDIDNAMFSVFNILRGESA